MKKQACIMAAAGVLAGVPLVAQDQVGVRYASQQMEVLSTQDSYAVSLPRVASTQGLPTIEGRPLSATEETKSVQTLGDGTEVANTTIRKIYRDTLGRTRTEQTLPDGRKTVSIRDIVNGFTITLDPDAKTAIKIPMPQAMMKASGVGGARGGAGGVAVGGVATGGTFSTGAAAGGRGEANAVALPRSSTPPSEARAVAGTLQGAKEEDLGVQSVNGVPAVGTKHTITIPAGQIGNNRDIRNVTERWYSEDLKMMVKTVTSDPRFGVNTYQLTGIDRTNPSPSLFEIPGDYAVTERPAGGGGRGGGGGMVMPSVKKQ